MKRIEQGDNGENILLPDGETDGGQKSMGPFRPKVQHLPPSFSLTTSQRRKDVKREY